MIVVGLCAALVAVLWTPSQISPYTIPDVVVYSTVSMFATGLGALPFLFLDFARLPTGANGVCNSIAAGVMLAASISLMHEGKGFCARDTSIGVLFGVIFAHLSHLALRKWNVDEPVVTLFKRNRVILMMGIMTLHSFAEGMGIGVSFAGGAGVVMALAIGVHNIPEGLAIALVMLPQGENKWKVVLYAIVSSLPQPLLAYPAFILAAQFAWLLPLGYGASAGAMLWVVFAEILTEARLSISPDLIATLVVLSMVCMTSFQTLIESM